jgi:hypothetical protein
LKRICGAILYYSTLVYFLTEFLTQRQRANLPMVVFMNIPYPVMPCLLVWRPSCESSRPRAK